MSTTSARSTASGIVRPDILLVLVPVLPLVGFLLLAFGGHRLDGKRAAAVGSAIVGLAFIAAAGAALGARAGGGTLDAYLFDWIYAGREEVALTVATAELKSLEPVDRADVGRIWWPSAPAVELLLRRMWDPDGAAGVRPIQANVAAGDILTDLNLPAAPRLVTGEVPRRSPVAVDVALHLDPLSVLMILLVTGVGFLIHLYSAGYMANDDGLRRYFAYLNLFTFSMLLLVLADDFLVMFVGWELVGLCSYLLIGFWYSDVANASAGRKAFLVNRVGDFAFVIGLLAIWSAFGSLAFEAVLPLAPTVLASGSLLATGIALCLLIGATGKSAQIPLFVWLPDAMAGPTPVSALIHAATMVTAGVYMIARAHTLFASAPMVLDLIGVIGAATALIGALIAVVQVDIKRVLAYSTVSQLGFMFLALGAGAFAAAIFHLMAHAFFKALLFLGAGSVMHAMEHGFHQAPPLAGEPANAAPLDEPQTSGPRGEQALDKLFADTPSHQDIRLMGGLARRVRWTSGTFAIGALALAGLFPLVGFWSKDDILHAVLLNGGLLWQVLYAVALATAGVTAYYAGRLLFRTFAGAPRSVGAELATESPPVMVGPLVALAILTVAGGLAAWPTNGGTWLTDFLAPSLGHPTEAAGPSKLLLAAAALAVSMAGLVLAWRRYGRAAVGVTSTEPSPFHRWAAAGFYIDQAYAALIAQPFRRHADWLWHRADDGAIDGSVNAVGRAMVRGGQVLRRTQAGYTRGYALSVLAGAALLAAYFVFAARP